MDLSGIERYLRRTLDSQGYPSLCASIVDATGIRASLAYGIADREHQRNATPDTLYYVGSITKVFTASLMCVLRDEGRFHLDDPVSQYLPARIALPTHPHGAPAITFRHLATHTSGLPRLPLNILPSDDDPYAGYDLTQLYAALNAVDLLFPIGARIEYSNLGYALLGHALEQVAGELYAELLSTRLLVPLGMNRTGVSLAGRPRRDLASGYATDATKAAVRNWDLGHMAPAGGLLSSANELARFLALQLRAGEPQRYPIEASTLAELHAVQRFDEGGEAGVGLGWHVLPTEPIGDIVWHDGGVLAHQAFIGFAPALRVGVLVLTNCDKPVDEVGFALLYEVTLGASEGESLGRPRGNEADGAAHA